MPILQFAPFSSVVSPAFWHKLTDLKIDVLRLSDDAIPVTATYTPGRSIVDRETGNEVVMPVSLSVDGDSFQAHSSSTSGETVGQRGIKVEGTFKNFNTIEDFKNADKNALFNAEAEKIWSSIVASKSTKDLSRFLLITFADLKKYKYYYWFAFPAFVAKPAWEISDNGWQPVSSAEGFGKEELAKIESQINDRPFFVLSKDGSSWKVNAVEDWDKITGERILGFIDPSADTSNPGWPLRNLLAYIRAVHPASSSTLKVVRWRDASHATIGTVSIADAAAGEPATARPSAVGWERNPAGKLGARMADLAPMMDPTRLAAQAVDLNLKLMRWRILPQLDLEKVSETKCLLLGAGTLGCYVARGLMGWGVRNITFLDSARVSFSNPVRQPLFEFEDCLEGGKPKAECAAERLKKVFPGINARGVSMSIPMPGHPIPAQTVQQAKADVEALEKLIDEHDAVFLLMDSRESRWLPTVIGASKNKIVINAALGFDTYLVMRHGARASTVKTDKGHKRLGCYYCNDIVAPGDSLTDRTLDQMCTVTRPGLAPIAAATAVELLTSILQHPDGIHAQPPPPSTSLSSDPPSDGETTSVLGQTPHQLRGFLSQSFRSLPLIGASYDRCTGCSEVVLGAYEKEGWAVLEKVFNDEGYLEKLSGLDKLKEEGEAALEAVEWEEEGEDDF